MKVTAQEEYGLRCLLQLARNAASPQPMTVREIAAGEGLSSAYAAKLLRLLSRAGLADAVRGIRGGYRISRPPERVTVGEVIRALGGFLSPVELCTRFTGNEDWCVHNSDCGLRPVWSALTSRIEQVLDRLPLSALLRPEMAAIANLEQAMRFSSAGQPDSEHQG